MWTVLVSHCPERTTKHLLILQKHNLNKKPCFEYYFESMFLYFRANRHHHHHHRHPNPSFDPVYGKPNQTVGIKGEAGRPFTLIKWIGRPRQCLYCAPNHQLSRTRRYFYLKLERMFPYIRCKLSLCLFLQCVILDRAFYCDSCALHV